MFQLSLSFSRSKKYKWVDVWVRVFQGNWFEQIKNGCNNQPPMRALENFNKQLIRFIVAFSVHKQTLVPFPMSSAPKNSLFCKCVYVCTLDKLPLNCIRNSSEFYLLSMCLCIPKGVFTILFITIFKWRLLDFPFLSWEFVCDFVFFHPLFVFFIDFTLFVLAYSW